MTPVDELSRTKYGLATAFMTGAALYILSQPLWVQGGFDALIANRDGGRGWWPILAVCATLIAVSLPNFWIRLLTWQGPAIFVRGADLHVYSWKQPLPISLITSVEPVPGNLIWGQFARVKFALADGRTKTVPTMFLDKRPAALVGALNTALRR